MEDVCIIGGGVTGILCCKIALSSNLNPIILEKNSSFGGIWEGSDGKIGIWNTLTTNISKFMLAFSDHLWPETADTFPLGSEYLKYLLSYISKHNLLNYFHFNTEVVLLEKIDEGYLVTYKNQEGTHSRVFKKVIVATGQISKFKDCIKKKEIFKGEILKAGYYKNPAISEGKKVVVIGSGYSSCDIASDMAPLASSLTLVHRKKFCINTRMVAGAPGEFYEFNFPVLNEKFPLFYSKECHGKIIKNLIRDLGNPGDLNEDLRIMDEEIENEYVAFPITHESFFENIRNNKIKCVRGSVLEYCENGIVLESGQVIEADLVVDSTGYTIFLDFLGDKIKEIADYDPRYYRIPLTLFRNCIHPTLPGLAFAGIFQTYFPGFLELSAELCVRWVKGELNLTEAELWEGVRSEKNYREESLVALWVYDIYGFLSEIIRILNIEFDWDLIDSLEYRKGFIGPVFYYKDREGQRETVCEYVRQIKKAFPEYPFN